MPNMIQNSTSATRTFLAMIATFSVLAAITPVKKSAMMIGQNTFDCLQVSYVSGEIPHQIQLKRRRPKNPILNFLSGQLPFR
jgi:hypothetical protein